MRIIDTFMFADSEEFPLFIAKILSEEKVIDHFIVVEASHTFKGEPRMLILKKLVNSEPLLVNFRDRITIIEANNLLDNVEFENYFKKSLIFIAQTLTGHTFQRTMRAIRERKNFNIEKFQRNLAVPLLQEWGIRESDWIAITDVDEIIDASLNNRANLLRTALTSTNGPIIHLKRQRYVFDIDNLDGRVRWIPIISTKIILQKDFKGLLRYRVPDIGVMQPFFQTIVFEFSYCFSFSGIERKLQSFSHRVPPIEQVHSALNYNHAIVYNTTPPRSMAWFSKVAPSQDSHPSYILNHLNSFRTNNVNPLYEFERLAKYPSYFKK